MGSIRLKRDARCVLLRVPSGGLKVHPATLTPSYLQKLSPSTIPLMLSRNSSADRLRCREALGSCKATPVASGIAKKKPIRAVSPFTFVMVMYRDVG